MRFGSRKQTFPRTVVNVSRERLLQNMMLKFCQSLTFNCDDYRREGLSNYKDLVSISN